LECEVKLKHREKIFGRGGGRWEERFVFHGERKYAVYNWGREIIHGVSIR